MKRDISVIDFPESVAAAIIRDAELPGRSRSKLEIPFKSYLPESAKQPVVLTETDHGNLSFTCPNCNRLNIVAQENCTVVTCKFCFPAKSPD